MKKGLVLFSLILGSLCFGEEIITHYLNGQIKEKYNIINNQIQGEYLIYYSNGNLQEKRFFKNGQIEGEALVYYENGNIKSKDFYKDDKPYGEHTSYYENGNISRKTSYEDGNPHEITSYYDDGKIKSIQIIDIENLIYTRQRFRCGNGERNFSIFNYIEHYENEVLKKEIFHNNGNIFSTTSYKNGIPYEDISYKDGITYITSYKDGSPYEVISYKNEIPYEIATYKDSDLEPFKKIDMTNSNNNNIKRKFIDIDKSIFLGIEDYIVYDGDKKLTRPGVSNNLNIRIKTSSEDKIPHEIISYYDDGKIESIITIDVKNYKDNEERKKNTP